MKGNKIIVHALIKTDEGYLVTKRSIKENTYPEYWDIPGGLSLDGELPIEALVREVKEEVNLDILPIKVIHEDSNLDKEKDLIFIRLVYISKLKNDLNNLILDKEEHSEYKIINSLKELKDEKICPFVREIFKNL